MNPGSQWAMRKCSVKLCSTTVRSRSVGIDSGTSPRKPPLSAEQQRPRKDEDRRELVGADEQPKADGAVGETGEKLAGVDLLDGLEFGGDGKRQFLGE